MIAATLWRWRVALMAVGVGALAGLLRFASLSYPTTLVFDEVFYVRGAYSLATLGYEGDWSGENQAFANGDYSGLSTDGDFIVHPMVGKMLIAAGIELFGPTPFGWRVMIALFGTATVIIVALAARHLFTSTLWGGIAGVFLAVDGAHLVLSRTALLDGFMTFFVVAGFALLLVDRHVTRQRLLAAAPEELAGWGPRTGVRWWRLAAILMFAIAASTKWSGLYFAAAYLVLSVVFDVLDRRSAGVERWFWSAAVRAVPAAITTVVVTLGVYVATWWSWFTHNDAYGRQWAAMHPTLGAQWLPEPLRALMHYHSQMWTFHTNLTSEHNYMSNPFGWILQLRPTAFHYEDADVACGAERCVSAIHAIGHPLIWWFGAAALLFALYRIVRHRDMLALTVALGVLAGWVPWWPYYYRTIFTFYSVAMAPWVTLTAVWALAWLALERGPGTRWRPHGWVIVGLAVAVVLIVAAFFAPIWIGWPIPFQYWQAHMWMPSWV